jgi:transcriptional regulator of met regulon
MILVYIDDRCFDDARRLAADIPEPDRAKWTRRIDNAETCYNENCHEAFLGAYYGGDCPTEAYERNGQRDERLRAARRELVRDPEMAKKEAER